MLKLSNLFISKVMGIILAQILLCAVPVSVLDNNHVSLPNRAQATLRNPLTSTYNADRAETLTRAVEAHLNHDKAVLPSNQAIEVSFSDIADNPALIARLGEALSGTRNVMMPENEKILIFEHVSGEATAYQGDLIAKLNEKNNVTIITLNADMPNGKIIQHLKKVQPTIIMQPDAAVSSVLTSTVQTWSEQQTGAVLGFDYATMQAPRQHNLYVPYDEAAWKKKEAAILANTSQTDRLPYEKAAQASNKANAIIHNVSAPAATGMQKKYAEVFTIKKIKNGEWSSYGTNDNDRVYTLDDIIKVLKGGEFLVGSPHMDDLSIALGVLVLKSQANVTDFVMTAGHRAFIGGIDDAEFKTTNDFTSLQQQILQRIDSDNRYLLLAWRQTITGLQRKLSQQNAALSPAEETMAKIILSIKLREEETIKSDPILGVTKTVFCNFPFYEYTENGERVVGTDAANNEAEKTYAMIEALYQKSKQNSSNLVIAIPSYADAHPDHRATHRIFEAALKRFTEEKGVEVTVILYVAPWFGAANVYNYLLPIEMQAKLNSSALSDAEKQALRAQAEAYALTGGELVCTAFGAKPDYKHLGGKFCERINVSWLRKPIAPSNPFIKVDGADYTVRIFGTTFTGDRNAVRNEVFNSIVKAGAFSWNDQDAHLLAQLVTFTEIEDLKNVYSDQKQTDEKDRFIDKVISFFTQDAYNGGETNTAVDISTFFHDFSFHSTINGAAGQGAFGPLLLVEKLVGINRNQFGVRELSEHHNPMQSNRFVDPLSVVLEKAAAEGDEVVGQYRSFRPQCTIAQQRYNTSLPSILFQEHSADLSMDERLELIAGYAEKTRLHLLVLDSAIRRGVQKGIDENTLLEYALYDPSGKAAERWGETRMPTIGELRARGLTALQTARDYYRREAKKLIAESSVILAQGDTRIDNAPIDAVNNLLDLGWAKLQYDSSGEARDDAAYIVKMMNDKIDIVAFPASYAEKNTQTFLNEVDTLNSDQRAVIVTTDPNSETQLKENPLLQDRIDKDIFILYVKKDTTAAKQWMTLLKDGVLCNPRDFSLQDFLDNTQALQALAELS